MPSIPRLPASLQLSIALALLMIALGAMQNWSEPWLEFNRRAIVDGQQWWRVLTSHWVHYGRYHLALNLGAFLLCVYILFPTVSLRHFSALLLTCMLSVGLGVYALSPDMAYYTGLSGVLHGLLVAGVLLTFKTTPWMNGLALVVVAAKIIQEQLPGFDASHPLLPVPVAVDAHLYGTLAGLFWGLGFIAWRVWRERQR